MASSAQKSALNIVMGPMTFGEPGKEGARVHDIKDVEAILDAFKAHGHTEIDSARTYAGGTSEEYLGKAGEELSRRILESCVAMDFPTYLLKREYNDAVLIGASNLKHIEENWVDLEKAPLREFSYFPQKKHED
ncbi:hypothetical protein M413DRAFT_21233 [Hebeloma cylindrosporum]|uniref:NADP-dependent oxidoreductase domain-containing protein n=1 Tax=Hebeloma cylindrosporum TaxID=76867 RepID=A0A0C3CYL2_HEBCY|nr:hypothetical protein M413DRAFT_21233 [Hebeloma cylindrosporum h7]